MPKYYKTVSTALDENLREKFDKLCMKEDVSRHTKLLNMIKEELKPDEQRRELGKDGEPNREQLKEISSEAGDSKGGGSAKEWFW